MESASTGTHARPIPFEEHAWVLSLRGLLVSDLGCFLLPANSLTFSGLMENPLVGKKSKS